MSEPLLVPLPVLTTHCADRRDRGFLAWVAVANEVAHLLLDSAPIDSSTHALEIHIAGVEEPLVVLAEPMGPPTDEGFPLRLRPLDDAHEATLRSELFGEPAPAQTVARGAPQTAVELPPRSESTIPPPLSDAHAASLRRASAPPQGTLARRAPGALTGRALGDGRFELEALLGGGASGEVYRARHAALRRPVAVKVLHPQLQQSPDYCARFYGEALAASRLDHRNVLRVLDYGQEPDSLLYIVMELLEGQSLQSILDDNGPLPLERIVHLVTQACAGLAHAHDAGVVHRDIKPENIVVVKRVDDEGSETERVKVCDFGIAHWTARGGAHGGEDATFVDLPDASQVVGTPAYMAPEQIKNEEVDARTDVYALGVVLFELATGQLPFDAESPLEMLSLHVHEPPRRPTELAATVDPRLEEIILKALEKDPARRHRDARHLRAELRDLVTGARLDPSGYHPALSLRAQLTKNDFLQKPAESLEALASAGEGTARALSYAALGEALKTSLAGGDLAVGRELAAWLAARVGTTGLAPDEIEAAERARLTLRDPDVLRPLVARLVAAKPDAREEITPLLAQAAPVAAHALIEHRKARMTSLELRSQFVTLLRALGPAALPATVAALEPLAPLATRQDEALAEDLLRSLPDVPSDPAGEVAVRFVRLDKPSVGNAALRGVSALWGTRARPLLVGMLDASSDTFRSLAIELLQGSSGIDDAALERLARMISAQTPVTLELRVAAAAALGAAIPECHTRAIYFARQRLAPQEGLMGSILKAIGPREDARVLAALARSLVRLEGETARPVLERLAAARPEIRPHLEAILARR